MAENTTVETVIFEVDVSDYQNKLVGLTQNIDALKTQQKALREETEKGGKGYLKAAEELEKVNAELKVSQDEYRNTQRTLVGFIGAQKNQVDTTNFANNSIKANRELLKQLQSQYINTKNPSDAFTKTILNLTNELKKQEGAIGNTSRNVGNYAEGFKEAAKDLNLFGVNLGGVGAGLRASRDGFVAAGGGVKGFSAALATTGLPLIIMGVQALIGAFETFKPVADAVEDAVTGLSAAFKAFTTGGSMVDAYNQTKQYNDILRELEDTQKSFEVQQAKYELQIERLALQSKNRNRTEQQRRNLIKQANDLEVQSFDERQKRNKEEIDNEANKFNILAKLNKADLIATLMGTKEEQKLFRERLEARGKFDEATFNKIQDLLLKRVSIERESISIREKLNNRDAALDDQITKEKEQELEKRRIAQEKRDAQEAKRVEKLIADKQKEKDALLKIEDEYNKAIEQQAEDKVNADAKRMANEAKMFEESQNAQAARLKAYQDAEAAKVAATKAAAQQNIQTQQAELNASASISNSLIGLISTVAEASGASAEFGKALGLINILVSQGVALAQSIASASILPFPANLGAIAASIGTITGLIGTVIKTFSATPTVPKFADGGEVFDVGGKPHSQGGTKYRGEDGNVIEVERGEKMFVMKATAAKQIHKLSQFNQMFGGRSWNGAPVNYAAQGGVVSDGGFSTSMVTEQIKSDIQTKNAIREAFINAPQPIVSVREITNVTKAVNKSVAVSELG